MYDFANRGEMSRITWEEFKNDSGEQIPAFACMRVTGMTTLGGRNVLTVQKPNTYGSQYMHRLNGPFPVEIGKYGICTRSAGAAALYDTADGTPALGERWGPRDATWKLKKNTGGWMVMGNSDATNGIVIVQQAPMLSFVGKCDAAIAKNAKGTVSIYYRSSLTAYTDTTVNMSDVYNTACDTNTSDYVEVNWDNDAAQPYWRM